MLGLLKNKDTNPANFSKESGGEDNLWPDKSYASVMGVAPRTIQGFF
jgi:hypothetical protein